MVNTYAAAKHLICLTAGRSIHHFMYLSGAVQPRHCILVAVLGSGLRRQPDRWPRVPRRCVGRLAGCGCRVGVLP